MAAAELERSFELGPLARALEARSEPPALPPPGRGRARLRVRFREEALPPEDRARLAESPLSLTPAAGGGLASIEGPVDLLEELAHPPGGEPSPGLAVLLAAHRNAARAPAPPELLGVLNVTPDSFSDGGRFAAPRAALAQARRLKAAGAGRLDIGGESTRPGAPPVPAEVELDRVLPVVRAVLEAGLGPVSVDTTKSVVARAALEAGADTINDVSAGRFDPELVEVVAEHGARLILMHLQGTPRDMQLAPTYDDVVREVLAHLRERAAHCVERGVLPARLAIDPGIGFGKRLADNLALIRALPALRSLGLSVVLGVSRKSFLGRITGTREPAEREAETLAAVSAGVLLGADVLRVHDVAAAARAVRVAAAIRDAELDG